MDTPNTPQEGDAVAETTAKTDVTAAAPAADETPSTSTEDLTALIETERKRGKPDPDKARERFLKKHQREKAESEDEDIDDDDRPITKRELERLLAEQAHSTTVETQEDKIIELTESYAETAQEAELIREIHKNRVYPLGMPLREQIEEARIVANAKRTEAKNAELARKVQSQQNVSRNTATTHRDPQASLEPELAPDLKVSMQRAGYTFNSTSRRYEKKLPNGKILVKESGKPPYLAG